METPDAWRDFHHRFVPAMSAAILKVLPDRYIIKVEETIYIRELSAEQRRLAGRPDASAMSLSPVAPGTATAVAPTGMTRPAPVTAELVPAVDIERVPYLEIVDRFNRAVVTVIELLSPSNKSNPDDRAAYLAKRQQLRAGNAHFVELDLLRGGPRMPLVGLPGCDYYALVSRAEQRPKVGIWPIMMRDRLPSIAIPLTHGDADISLDLQRVFNRVYDEAGYGRYIHSGYPEPSLSVDDQLRAASLLSS